MNVLEYELIELRFKRECDDYKENYQFRLGYEKAMHDAINLVKNVTIVDYKPTFNDLIDRLEYLSLKLCPNRIWDDEFRGGVKILWGDDYGGLLNYIKKLEKRLNLFF